MRFVLKSRSEVDVTEGLHCKLEHLKIELEGQKSFFFVAFAPFETSFELFMKTHCVTFRSDSTKIFNTQVHDTSIDSLLNRPSVELCSYFNLFISDVDSTVHVYMNFCLD